MWSSFVAFFIEHQAVIFGILSGIVALVVVLPLSGSINAIETLGKQIELGRGESKWRKRFKWFKRFKWLKWLLWVPVVATVFGAGYSCGHQDIISATGHLQFPKLICDHQGSTLILFLHGWRGDAQETWKLYPHLVCGDRDFADVDVLSISYPTYIVQGNLTMEQLGSWLADKLVANSIVRYRRVVVIAHSIGGLVARRLVLERRPELKNIVFLLEIATPHTGPANYAQILKQIGVKGGKLVEELKEGSTFLSKLKTDWQDFPSKPHTYCIGSPQDWLVTIASAHDSCTEPHFMPTYDHRDIVKPENIDEDRYRIPMYAVREFLRADGVQKPL